MTDCIRCNRDRWVCICYLCCIAIFPVLRDRGQLIRLDTANVETIMRKTILILTAAAAALTSSIGMAAEGKQSFVHEGNTYVYTSSLQDGRQVIDGRRFPSGQTFHLIVKGDRVSGTSGGTPVSFKTRDASGAAGGLAATAR